MNGKIHSNIREIYNKNEIINPTIYDSLYGKISFDELIPGKKKKLFSKRELMRIINSVELQRLRFIRLSNINSLFLYSSSNVTRFEHSIGTAYLATLLGNNLDVSERDKCHLFFAALLHDVASPPFGHSVEYIFQNLEPSYSHEENIKKILMDSTDSEDGIFGRHTQIWGEEVSIAESINKIKVKNENLDALEVAKIISGNHHLSALINSKDIDLDNIDNIYRLISQMGFPIDRKDIIDTVLGFKYRGKRRLFDANRIELLQKWLENRNLLYNIFMFNPYDFAAKTMIMYATQLGIKSNVINGRNDWAITDDELLDKLSQSNPELGTIIHKFKKSDFFFIEGLFLTSDDNTISKFLDYETKNKIEKDISGHLNKEIVINFIYDKGKLSREIVIPIIDEMSISKEEKEYKIGNQSKSMLIGIFSKGDIKNSFKIKDIRNTKEVLSSIIGDNCSIFPTDFDKEIRLKDLSTSQLDLGAFKHEQ